MAKAAAEERALFTDRMATRSTTQNRTSRLIGKKMNRSVSLTIYWKYLFQKNWGETIKSSWWIEFEELKEELHFWFLAQSSISVSSFTEIALKIFNCKIQLIGCIHNWDIGLEYLVYWKRWMLIQKPFSYTVKCYTVPGLTTIVVCCFLVLLHCNKGIFPSNLKRANLKLDWIWNREEMLRRLV